MSLSALPIALAIPPLNLLPVCLAGLLVSLRYRRVGLAVVTLGLGALLLLGMPFVAGLLIVSLERDLALVPPPADPPQAIVILSADMQHSAGSSEAMPGPLTLERERAGAALSRRTGLPILVTGGMGEGQDTLAAIMARSLAEDFNAPVRWTEPRATDTWENATDSAAILRTQHIRSVYIVTHAWHMKRAAIAFAQTGITVTMAPVRLDKIPAMKLSNLVPHASAWLDSYYALHEWIGCAEYALLR